MKVGDLVRIAPHCINKGRLALVTRVEDWDRQTVWITYVDGGEDNSSPFVEEFIINVVYWFSKKLESRDS